MRVCASFIAPCSRRLHPRGGRSFAVALALTAEVSGARRRSVGNKVLVDGYIRVSQVAGRRGASFISPSVQREQIEGWAKLHGATIAEIFEELDESGARSDRPMLMHALQRVESGQSQGIVVAKLDRFGRSLVDGLANIERIRAAGGTFVSVQDGLDLGTPTGKLILRIMFSMAEWELDRVRDNWDVAQARAVSRGIHGGGYVPLGYNRVKPGGRLRLNKREAPVVAEVFRRRGEGASVRDLVRYLNSTGLKTKRGKSKFVDSSVSNMMRNRVYLGEARSGPHVKADAHPAIVDEASWQQAQHPRRARQRPRRSLLGAVVRCAECGLAMHTQAPLVSSESSRPAYRCPGHSSIGPCPRGGRVYGDEIEGLVEDFVFRLVRSQQAERDSSARVVRCAGKLDKTKEALVRYRDNSSALLALGPESFAAGLAKRKRDVERASLEMAAARLATEVPDVPPADELEASWPELSIEERRHLIEQFIDCIFIDGGTGTVLERAYVCRRGNAPIDVPRRGLAIGRRRSFRPGLNGMRSTLLRPMKPWGSRRIEKELLAWRGDDDRWPHYVEFALAGRSRLWQQVIDWGGPYFWADRLGWEITPRSVTWTRERIRGALRGFLDGRTGWPTYEEFDNAGLATLRRAAARHGGLPFWAKAFDLPYKVRHTISWPIERIETELVAYLFDRSSYPLSSEFYSDGRSRLYAAINRNGGHGLWAGKIGLSRGGANQGAG